MSDRIHVAVAVISDRGDNILVSQRPDDAHQGGLWEFPGGKLEPGETRLQALQRECHEELGIQVEQARPLIQITHDYPDRRILLDVWKVTAYSGVPQGREGQPVRWISRSALAALPMPAADVPICSAIQLPDRYLITPDFHGTLQGFTARIAAGLEAGMLLQLRVHSLPGSRLPSLVRALAPVCEERGVGLLVNTGIEQAVALGVGVHLSAVRLSAAHRDGYRHDRHRFLLAASCHSAQQLQWAQQIGANFVVLSPVRETRSHPQARPLGWQGFSSLVSRVALPVYALGGMQLTDLAAAWDAGAQGIAGISAFWEC